MKKLNLSGRYSSEETDCHFEDIPIFLKMADLGKQNDPRSHVRICYVVKGEKVLSQSKILRWKIIKNEHDQLILAYRTSTRKANYPYIYKVTINSRIHEIVLKNITSHFSEFRRLEAWYYSSPKQISHHF